MSLYNNFTNNVFLSHYEKNPSYCSQCGKIIPVKKFYRQFEYEHKFCCKACEKSYKITNNIESISSTPFSSLTEKIIYTYLQINYPDKKIAHNIKNFIPPYEIDMCINYNESNPIFIEFNGSLHCNINKKKMKNKLEKTKRNDEYKKIEICNKYNYKLLRIWSEIGIYSREELFNKTLNIVKKSLDKLLICKTNNGVCIDIKINKDEQITVQRIDRDYIVET